MLASPGDDGHQDKGQQERPREMDLKRGRQREAQEEEARSRRYQVCRERRHELEKTHEEQAAQEEKGGWGEDVGGEIERPRTREEPSVGDPGRDQGEAPRKGVAEEDEACAGQDVQHEQWRVGFSGEKKRQADQKPWQGSGNLPVGRRVGAEDVGAEEGPLAGSEELEPEKIDLDFVPGAQLEAQSVVDSQEEQADEQEGQDRGRLSPLLKPAALLTYHRRRNMLVVVDSATHVPLERGVGGTHARVSDGIYLRRAGSRG